MNNNKQEDNFPKYEDFIDCMVGFVDILGFDSRVRNIQSHEDFFEIAKLLFTIKGSANIFNENKGLLKTLRITAISDSIIVTMPYHDPVCRIALIKILHQFQYVLLATDFKTLLRGYITRGTVYHRYNFIFGKGYSDAYIKEKEIGHAPRIVIDPSLVEDARKKISNYKPRQKEDHIFKYITEDSCDGYFFIDYLKPVGGGANLSKEQLHSERSEIKTFLESNLYNYRDNEKIFRKYKWLENYFSLSSNYF